MGIPLRSKQGCWTCKLRRKKCDETRPRCSTCESLSITCYGFGSRPEWMGNADHEKAILDGLKEIVKRTSRRKGISQPPRQQDPAVKIAPRFADGSGQGPASVARQNLQRLNDSSPSDHTSSQYSEEEALRGEDAVSSSPSFHDDDDQKKKTIFSISPDESSLLMNFLDVIFPLQYPAYKPNIRDGGRGWLLTLLLSTTPLYHAALAFSVYQRRVMMSEDTSRQIRAAALVQQEKHLDISITLVNRSIQGSCGGRRGIGIAIAICQLMFFELFTDNTTAWKAHLGALLRMCLHAYKADYTSRLGLAESTRQVLRDNSSVPEHDPAVAEEVVCFRLLTGTATWLDITSSITSGKTPVLMPYLSYILASESQIQLAEIMGGKNAIMFQVGRTAALYGQKIQALEVGNFDPSEFKQIARSIKLEIQRSLAESTAVGLSFPERRSSTVLSTPSGSQTLIPCLFARMAFVYIHLVDYGFQELGTLASTLSEAMEMLQTGVSKDVLPALIPPLFIIGSAASQRDQRFFRDAFSSPPLLDPLLKHRGRILTILEEIWTRRQTMAAVEWEDCLDLTADILLF